MKTAIINKIIPFSSVDGPGNRTAVFFQNCNFNCLYCHNPETINLCVNCRECIAVCPVNALSLEKNAVVWNSEQCCDCDSCIKVCKHSSSPKITHMNSDKLTAEIAKNLPFINGITVSGGECTLYHEFLTELFGKVKALGLTTFIDSNGLLPFKNMPLLMGTMDKAMLDIKAYDDKEHIKLTGQSNKTVIENINLLCENDKLFEIRTVVVPNILNNHLTVDMASKLIAPYPNVRYKLIKYRPMGVRTELINVNSPSDEMMNELREIAIKNGVIDTVIV